jgi:WD40 repeat protein
MSLQKVFDTQDGLYDVAWSEVHENQLVTASGDGSIKLWDSTLMDHPIRNWHEHSREVFSVDWNNIKKDVFVSSSWDASVKVVSHVQKGRLRAGKAIAHLRPPRRIPPSLHSGIPNSLALYRPSQLTPPACILLCGHLIIRIP